MNDKEGSLYFKVSCDKEEVVYRSYHDAECTHERVETKTYKLDKCTLMDMTTPFTGRAMNEHRYIYVQSVGNTQFADGAAFIKATLVAALAMIATQF